MLAPLMGPAKMMSMWLLLASWSPLAMADTITFGAIVSDINATMVSSELSTCVRQQAVPQPALSSAPPALPSQTHTHTHTHAHTHTH
jgi:hypothetical protein